MARKYERGAMSHLLIDRFRFDSFAPDSAEAGSNLLTRFGQTVHLFFVITPPDQLVERAWNRGLEVGRYKAVDDTLAHAVVAYGGFPDLFFTWARRSDKRFQFEFLDNTVALGERPRTVAFGDNSTFNLLDVSKLLDIERFARISVRASDPQRLYPDRAVLEARQNSGFLGRCLGAFRNVNLAEQTSGRIYLRLESGVPVWKESAGLARARLDRDTDLALRAVIAEPAIARAAHGSAIRYLKSETPLPTLGQWADR